MNESDTETAGWQLETSAAAAYETDFVPVIFEPWANRLIDRAGLRSGERVLDVACGTGIVARRAAPHVGADGAVVGLDVNEGMLSVATGTTDGSAHEIEWREGDATALPFDDDAFDVVLCQQGLQFVEEPVTALDEMRRVLAPGGRALVSVWRPITSNPAYVVLAEALERHVGAEAAAMMHSPFPDWDRSDLRAFAEEAGFSAQTIVLDVVASRFPSIEEFVRIEMAGSPLASEFSDESDRVALVRDVADQLDGYIDDEGLVSPMEANVLIVTK